MYMVGFDSGGTRASDVIVGSNSGGLVLLIYVLSSNSSGTKASDVCCWFQQVGVRGPGICC